MQTKFPIALDVLINPTGNTATNNPSMSHQTQHSNANDAIEALQTKVGINNQTDANSVDFKLRALAAAISGGTFTGGGDGGGGTITGAPIELSHNSTHIVWRQVGTTSWTNLIALSMITGPAGAEGTAGATGPKGDTGLTGPAGTNGATGPAGADGAIGPIGPIGPIADAGATAATFQRSQITNVAGPLVLVSGTVPTGAQPWHMQFTSTGTVQTGDNALGPTMRLEFWKNGVLVKACQLGMSASAVTNKAWWARAEAQSDGTGWSGLLRLFLDGSNTPAQVVYQTATTPMAGDTIDLRIGFQSINSGSISQMGGTTKTGVGVQGPTGQTLTTVHQLAVSDMTTVLTSGAGKAYFRAPKACTLVGIKLSLFTASTSGSVTTDLLKNGVSIMTTSPTILSGQKTSTTSGIIPVFSNVSVAADDELSLSITSAGTGAKGLIAAIEVVL